MGPGRDPAGGPPRTQYRPVPPANINHFANATYAEQEPNSPPHYPLWFTVACSTKWPILWPCRLVSSTSTSRPGRPATTSLRPYAGACRGGPRSATPARSTRSPRACWCCASARPRAWRITFRLPRNATGRPCAWAPRRARTIRRARSRNCGSRIADCALGTRGLRLPTRPPSAPPSPGSSARSSRFRRRSPRCTLTGGGHTSLPVGAATCGSRRARSRCIPSSCSLTTGPGWRSTCSAAGGRTSGRWPATSEPPWASAATAPGSFARPSGRSPSTRRSSPTIWTSSATCSAR